MVQESVKFMRISKPNTNSGWGFSLTPPHDKHFWDITIFDIVQKKIIIFLKHQFCLKFQCLTLLICFCPKWKQMKDIKRNLFDVPSFCNLLSWVQKELSLSVRRCWKAEKKNKQKKHSHVWLFDQTFGKWVRSRIFHHPHFMRRCWKEGQ